jgi:hypothetical protein
VHVQSVGETHRIRTVDVAIGHHGIVGPVLLAIALIYGIVQWSRRPRAAKKASDEATRRL